MDDLTPVQRDTLRQQLLTLQDELTTLLDLSVDSSKPVARDQPIGRLTRMDALQAQHMAQANRSSHEVRLHHIQAALAAMDDDTYGLCKSCEDPIGFPRLSVRPEAPFCLPCQEQREARR